MNQYLCEFKSKNSTIGKGYPVIFIVGLPRSGTTLLSQIISRFLPVGYINNLTARFWMNPVIGINLSRATLGPSFAREKIVLKSLHGVTEDPWGPHEFGYFWRHWLRLDESPSHKLTPTILDKIDSQGLSRSLKEMTSTFEMPLVFKNIICGLQASFLSRIYPQSLFVLIERDSKSVIPSILRCRKERYGNEKVYWSLKPGTYEQILKESDPQKQVERQVIDGKKDFQEEIKEENVNSLHITYENLCDDPAEVLRLLIKRMNDLGYEMNLLGAPPALKAVLAK